MQVCIMPLRLCTNQFKHVLISLTVCFSDLIKKDFGSASDPFVVVSEKRSNRIDKKTGGKSLVLLKLGEQRQ